ncbi:MAG: LysM peptidoglycan-binding domain-containing protein, partial [Anaerolineales bacterium]|nr:LysM peptidoglycan-binding domain-containing protein [Anaerolineales bacterium]
MKKFFEKVRFVFASKLKHSKPKDTPAVREPSTAPRGKRKADRFTLASWAVTFFIVAALLGSTIFYKSSRSTAYIPEPAPTKTSGVDPIQVGAPVAGSGGGGGSLFIPRKLQLKTNIPERPRYAPVIYRVSRGDAMLSIAEEFKIKTETILYVNKQLDDNPHNIKPGTELSIPPVDGLYYEWKDGDTFDAVAAKFDANPDDIIAFPGNNVDLTDPKITPGALVMIPGGSRELRNWAADLQTAVRGANTGTGGGNASNGCGGGPVASGCGWPADDHTLSGNPYGPGHLGIDITAPEGSAVYAAGAGVVTQA